jgi:hypothetical protein
LAPAGESRSTLSFRVVQALRAFGGGMNLSSFLVTPGHRAV